MGVSHARILVCSAVAPVMNGEDCAEASALGGGELSLLPGAIVVGEDGDLIVGGEGTLDGGEGVVEGVADVEGGFLDDLALVAGLARAEAEAVGVLFGRDPLAIIGRAGGLLILK